MIVFRRRQLLRFCYKTLVLKADVWYIICIDQTFIQEGIMMKVTKEQGLKFLNEMQRPITSKEQIFDALFEVCGAGDNVNTKHVFFQEVIIKFNASKAMAVIANHMPYETESHYVDIAINAYIKAGFNMREFDKDLTDFKAKYNFLYSPFANGVRAYANA